MTNNFDDALPIIKKHFQEIFKVCNRKFIDGCGSYLFDGKTYQYSDDYYDKQKFGYEICTITQYSSSPISYW